jgi:hypothetical protein
LAFTFWAPVCVGLAAHALIQLDRRMLFIAGLTGVVGLVAGSLPAAFRSDRDARGHAVRVGAGGDRRYFVLFLLFTLLAGVSWSFRTLGYVFGALGLLMGIALLVSQGRSDTRRPGSPVRLSDIVTPWCYAVGPAGAVALAALAMRPDHLGAWRAPIYLGLGRVAAVAAIVFWVMVEREIRRQAKSRGEAPADAVLPYRVLIFLLAATGFLVPGGGSPYAVSWAVAWLMAALFERRLRIT